MLCRITSAAQQDAWADAYQAYTASLTQFLQHLQFFPEIVEIDGHGTYSVPLGELLHGLKEIAAGHHRAIAGVLKNALQFLHRHHFNGHIQAWLEFLGDQH